VIRPGGLKTGAPDGRSTRHRRRECEEAAMPSVAFDEGLLRTMADYIVAVNRLKHAQDRVDADTDPTYLRLLSAGEQEAEQACVAALLQRGWQPPYVTLSRGA
jgi:hypothetical protein